MAIRIITPNSYSDGTVGIRPPVVTAILRKHL
jgi:hypothetical protein